MKVLGSRNVTNGEVKQIIEDIRNKGFELDQLAIRVEEYTRKFNKCSKGEELVEELINGGLTEITAVMIANIVPKNKDEVKALLTFEHKNISDELVKDILQKVSKYCKES